MDSYISAHIAEAQRVMAAMLDDKSLLAKVEAAARACIVCLNGSGKSIVGRQRWQRG